MHMNYLTEFDNTKNICKFNIDDEILIPRDVYQLQLAAVEVHKKLGCRKYLFDVTRAKIISGTLPAIQAASPPKEQAQILRRLKIAILYKKLTGHENFVETVAVNRGFTIKVFEEMDEATSWLGINFNDSSENSPTANWLSLIQINCS